MAMPLANRILQILVLLPALLFLVTGMRWLVAPAGVAPEFGLTLGEGVGLSSQVGDMAGFFLTLGSCMLIALISAHRTWYYPAIMLLAITAVGRVVAWLVHDATLALDLIAPEVIVALILLAASRRLPETS
ncbi:hypothetical protein CWI75_11895 [Kineobactrum sediminis]|uniref:DUF4345 domain-containing protein n=2 Tax=Kineobactrum sediminis TaxID=1905677 RepID=A0A2N5Y237_9GAMM|nr:hypothetical protein CWI75_11895 [Kineobactrum sediminis]